MKRFIRSWPFWRPFNPEKLTRHSRTHARAGLLDGGHRLVDAVHELADVLKVPGHLRGQHHVDDRLPQRSELIPASRGGVRLRSGLV